MVNSTARCGLRGLLAALALAAAAQNGRSLPTTEAKSNTSSPDFIRMAKALDGLTLIPVWAESGKRAPSSAVLVRVVAQKGQSPSYVQLEVLLRSFPTRATGPDDDRAGADPDQVQLRSLSLMRGRRIVREYAAFAPLYSDGEPSGDPRTPARYSGATREYTAGKPGPAFFQSRCVVRVPTSMLGELGGASAVNGHRPDNLTVRILTGAGELFVPLVGSDPAGLSGGSSAHGGMIEAALDTSVDARAGAEPWQ